MEDKKVENVFYLPNPEKIPCLTCKHGLHNFLASYCLKYELKPNGVYFDNKPCEKYEPIEEKVEKDVDNESI